MGGWGPSGPSSILGSPTYMKNYKKVLSHFKKVDPKIYLYVTQIDYNKWFEKRPKRGEHAYFHSLCRAIIGQQLSGKAAETIYGRFKDLLNDEVTPENILSLDDQNLRDVGMSWSKVSYAKDLAQKVLDGEVHLTKLDDMANEEVVRELTTIKGIGEWTVEMFLMFTLNREDIFSFGDLGLKKGIMKVYEIENPTKEQIEKIIAPWSPYKTYGSIALWESLEIK